MKLGKDPEKVPGGLTANPRTAAITGFLKLEKLSSTSFSHPIRCASAVEILAISLMSAPASNMSVRNGC